MTEYDAAREDEFTIPAEWIDQALVTARPGNGVRYPFEPDPETAAWFSKLVEEHRDAMAAAWDQPSADPAFAESALDYLNGEATPLGLSLVSSQLRRRTGPCPPVRRHRRDPDRRGDTCSSGSVSRR
jgi:hypothetical protein